MLLKLSKPLAAIVLVAGLSTTAFADDVVKTRFGTLAVSANLLTLNNSVTIPRISGNNSLDIERNIYQMGDIDAVLVGDNGGSMCPRLYWVALVSRTGVRMTSQFGTCSEDVSAKVAGGKLIIVQPTFAPRGMPAPASGKRETFVVDPASGSVTKPNPSQ